jgi:hypothetical protein
MRTKVSGRFLKRGGKGLDVTLNRYAREIVSVYCTVLGVFIHIPATPLPAATTVSSSHPGGHRTRLDEAVDIRGGAGGMAAVGRDLGEGRRLKRAGNYARGKSRTMYAFLVAVWFSQLT